MARGRDKEVQSKFGFRRANHNITPLRPSLAPLAATQTRSLTLLMRCCNPKLAAGELPVTRRPFQAALPRAGFFAENCCPPHHYTTATTHSLTHHLSNGRSSAVCKVSVAYSPASTALTPTSTTAILNPLPLVIDSLDSTTISWTGCLGDLLCQCEVQDVLGFRATPGWHFDMSTLYPSPF